MDLWNAIWLWEWLRRRPRGRVAALQASGGFPWIGADDPSEIQRVQAEHADRVRRVSNFQVGGPGKFTEAHDPRHVLQTNGGLTDIWYMDDGDILCHPLLVPTYLLEFDVANAKVAAVRNPLKTEVIYCVNDLNAAPPEWRVRDVQNMAKVSTAIAGSITLGVAVGPRQFIADQLVAKADVIRAMHERVQLCQDPQTVFALLRESLGVSRINHILRVHGHTILQEQRAAEIYDEVGYRSLERLVLCFTEDSMEQATLSAGHSGIGYKRARDIAVPAHLGALIAAQPRIQAMIQNGVTAGLLPKHSLETQLAAVIETASPPTLTLSMMRTKPRQSCTFRRRPRSKAV